MRTYISTLGFHEARVTRPLLRREFDDEDVVVLLRPANEPDDDRGSDAVDYVEDMLHEIAPGATITVERIDGADFEAATEQCSDVIRAAEGELIVNFGGGAREIFLPLTIATILHAQSVDTALQYTDVSQEVREWTVPNLAADVPANAWATLQAVSGSDSAISIPDLHVQLDTSKSTISRHISDLEEQGLVSTEMRGKTKCASPTLAARLVLRRRD